MRLAYALVLLAGCDLYFGHHQVEDDQCVPDPNPDISLRDPSTGACNTINFDCTCENPCGIDLPLEPQCNGPCEGLPEGVCVATAGCHAAYQEGGPDRAPATFTGCWDIGPVTPIHGGECGGLDAFTCASHDDCVSMFGTDKYTGCAPEPDATC